MHDDPRLRPSAVETVSFLKSIHHDAAAGVRVWLLQRQLREQQQEILRLQWNLHALGRSIHGGIHRA